MFKRYGWIALCTVGGLLAGLAEAQETPRPPAQAEPAATPGNAPTATERPRVRTRTDHAVRPGGPPVAQANTNAAEVKPQVLLQIAQGAQIWGNIVVELEPEHAPRTVENFLQYVDASFYDGTIFHRVVPQYLAQGGGYRGIGDKVRDGIRRAIQNEARHSPLRNVRGTIAAARARNPNSATCEFFFNLADNPKLDHPSVDGYGYTVFGRVISGLDVLDRIAAVERQPNPQYPQELSQPVNPPMIRTARLLTPRPNSLPPRPGEAARPAVRRPDPATPAPRPGVRPTVPPPPVPEPLPDLPPDEPLPDPSHDPGIEPIDDPIHDPIPEPDPEPAPEPEPEPEPEWEPIPEPEPEPFPEFETGGRAQLDGLLDPRTAGSIGLR
ncbi:MAG: peptidylprolyl isomerase [Phycisphaerales bacterium]|nr:peptidylprolyl isomerase [Phycisphaerales bacterium]